MVGIEPCGVVLGFEDDPRGEGADVAIFLPRE